MTRMLSLVTVLAAVPALAETPTAAPDYYVDALFAVSTAELLVNFCGDVGLSTERLNAQAEAVLDRLSEDGFAGDQIVHLSGVEDGVASRQDAFMARHGLESPTEALICAAARQEIAEGTAIGAVLVEKN